MEFKGTKGKWILKWGGSNPCQDMLQIINEKGEEVCNFGDSTTYYPTEGIEPNKYDALLISKAPEMLEMLKWLVSHYEYVVKWDYSPFALRSDIDKARQLIKEATEI